MPASAAGTAEGWDKVVYFPVNERTPFASLRAGV